MYTKNCVVFSHPWDQVLHPYKTTFKVQNVYFFIEGKQIYSELNANMYSPTYSVINFYVIITLICYCRS
jgi:hypothetical protein